MAFNDKDIDQRFDVLAGTEEIQAPGSKVQVFLMRNPANGIYFLRVRLQSKFHVMTGVLFSQADLEITSNYEKQIQQAAFILAEKQNLEYHDKHDPDDCAKAALEAWKELAHNLRRKGLF